MSSQPSGKLVSVRSLTTRVAMVPHGERPTVLVHTANYLVTSIATGTCATILDRDRGVYLSRHRAVVVQCKSKNLSSCCDRKVHSRFGRKVHSDRKDSDLSWPKATSK